jgi:hypothetical protein
LKALFAIRSLAFVSALAATPLAMASAVTLLPTSAGVVSAAGSTAGGAPGFGTSSFSENGSTKGEIYVSSVALFGRQVRVADIASISYFTNKPGASSSVDWSFYIYTALTASGNAGSFYHSRLISEPYQSTTQPAVAANTWHQWTSGGSSAMTFYDSERAGNLGAAGDPTLANIDAGAVTWPSTGNVVDYRNELVNLFSLQTGSAWSAGFLGLVDGLTITLNDGEVGTVNLESPNAVAGVPEPESIALLVIGAIGLFAAARRKQRKA